MNFFGPLRDLDHRQRSAVAASFLGWALDAFDYFLLVFVIKNIADDFGTDVKAVTYATFLTLAMRPLGAFIFGILADRYGRRPVLMVDVVLYSVIELASAAAPSLTTLLILRALYGIAMGGEWGIGASLAMEAIPASSRGLVSGLLQEGYAVGYLLAAVVYYLLFSTIGWRGMFVVGVLPAFLVLYIRAHVEESAVWEERRTRHPAILPVIAKHWKRLIYVVLMMTAFNFLSHGTQDLYPTFLLVQHHLSPHAIGTIAIIYNIGALMGGIFFGAFSERIGRRRAIVIAALLVLPAIPLWAFAGSPPLLALGAFVLQFMVQGAWGVVPAHLNELSPPDARGTFPGFTYQLGNLLAAANARIEAGIAESHGNDYGLAMAVVCGVVALVLAIVTALGKEAKGVSFRDPAPP